jgi:arginyl-tRNA synthetase
MQAGRKARFLFAATMPAGGAVLETLRQALEACIANELARRGWEASPRVEVAPRRELGDLAWAGALPLAKQLRRPPREVGEELAQGLAAAIAGAAPEDPLALLEPAATVAGPGFLNFRLRRGAVLARALLAQPQAPPAAGNKVVVEHTNINPNKAAHIGHLRNAVLGDVLARALRFLGRPVEVQNYIDDTGVQVADVVVGFAFYPEAALLAVVQRFWPGVASRRQVLEELARRWEARELVSDELGKPDFDDLCWELYPQLARWYEEVPEAAAFREEVLHALEAGGGEAPDHVGVLPELARNPHDPKALAALGYVVATANLTCHLRTMARLGVAYDVLPHESHILRLGFWQRAFRALAEKGAIRFEEQGKNAGCWVMSLADSPEFAGLTDADKILVRSNGTVTYTGKDIAYQLWKLGLLVDEAGQRADFGYRPFARYAQPGPASPVEYGEGPRVLYTTTPDPKERPAGVSFGAGGVVYNVIDVRQAYPQKVVKEAVRQLAGEERAASCIHFAYEMVALSPKALAVLEARSGKTFGLSPEELAKPWVEMSGRRGIGVKADELFAALVEEAEKAILRRLEGQAPPEDLPQRAWAIAVGALRYQMVRQSRNRVLAFDFEDALAFEGDTGPYLQYAAVRAKKMFAKLAAAGLAATAEEDAAAMQDQAVPDDLWELVFACLRTREMVEKALATLELSLLAGHARELAQSFHNLYHHHPVLHAENPQLRALRRAVFRHFAQTIQEILQVLLGIPVPEEM